MFSRARWRLTLWFAGAFTLILVLIGSAVFFTARTVLFNQVDDALVARAERERTPLSNRILQRIRKSEPLREIAIGPAFTAGGYFYAVAAADGTVVGSTPNTDPQGLPDTAALERATSGGPTFADTISSEDEHLRVYLFPVGDVRDRHFVLEVGRSREPERQALQRLLLVLVAGGGVGLLLALGGGVLLAGWALRPIQTAMDRQRAFIADASHELRTPLSLIRANAEILKREAAKPVSANMTSVDDVVAETDRLSGLVGQLLSLARADSEETPSQPASVDVSELAADSVRQMRLLAEPRRITMDVQTNSPVTVTGDPMRLRELLTILLDNTIKYSDDGASVRVNVRRTGNTALLQVSDSGRGIPTEALPHIFDRFYRVDKARSREMGGAGLGLSIAKWIVESHRGTIKIDSSVGKGTTVTVELPAA